MAATTITGIKEVRKLFEAAGKAPAKVLTKATKSAGKVIQKAAKNNAPEDTGALRKHIKIKAEKAKKGKRVYQVWVDAESIKIKGKIYKLDDGKGFAKDSKYSKDDKGEAKRSFYPASQEYGWTTNGKYHPGFNYMHKAADDYGGTVKGLMLTIMASELDKLR